MPIFIDPRTGERYENVPDEEAERAQREFGLVTEDEWAAEQRPIGEKFERGVKAWGLGLGRGAQTALKPFEAVGLVDEPAPEEQAEFQEKAYGDEARELREESPIISAVAESVPIAGAGAAAGGAGVGLRGAAALLGAESAASGISQEAIDATMEKRDFSAKSALWNGVLELGFGALGYGAGKVVGSIGQAPTAQVADEAVPGVPGRRNFITEIDRGPVPDPARPPRPARSVGAASGATGDTMSRTEVARYIRDEDEIVDNLQTIAGGGPGERGAFQQFNDAFAESMNNRIKRADFDAAEAAMTPQARAALGAEVGDIAEDIESVAGALEARGAKKAANLLRSHVYQLESRDEIISVLDRSKATLDALHMKAITDVNDPYGEVLGTVDPVANRIRSLLENPEYVGKQIAEQQAVRNAAWSDKKTGFIRNMRIANEIGPKLFKKIEVDYHTGQLVMQYDPSGFKSMLGLDPHQAKPVFEAWQNILSSAEKMALSTAEVGAESAGRSPLMALQEAITDIRQIFSERDRLYAAKDIGRRGIETLGRVESMPFVGSVAKGARSIMGSKNLEAVAGSMGEYVPTQERSMAAAKARLAKRRGQSGFVDVTKKNMQSRLTPVDAKLVNDILPQRMTEEQFDRVMAMKQFDGNLKTYAWSDENTGKLEALHAINRFTLDSEPGTISLVFRQKGKTKEVVIDGFFLPDAAQGKGIGRKLINDAFAVYSETGIQRVVIEEAVQVGRYAWPKMGFRPHPASEKLAAEEFSKWRAAKDLAPVKAKTLPDIAKAEGGKEWLMSTPGPWNRNMLVNIKPGAQEGWVALGDDIDVSGRLAATRKDGLGIFDILKSPIGVTSGVGALALGAPVAYNQLGAEELPEKRIAREAYMAQLSQLPPDKQSQHIALSESLARIGAQAQARVRGAIAELFHGDKPRFLSPRLREVERRAAELDVPRAVARFMGRRTDDPVEAWKEKSELLQRLVADPSQIARAMAQNLGALPELQPEVFMKMVAQTMAAVEYLHALAPAPSGKSVLDPVGYPPSLEEITSWAGQWVGAIHPLDTLDDLAANDLVPEQMDAVRALHPDSYQLFQQTALSEIGRLRKKGKRIPMHALERIDTALELDGAGETTLSWQFANLIRAGEQQAAQTGQQPPQQSPMQSKGAERVASSAMASFRSEAGAAP